MPFSHHSHSGQFCGHAANTLQEVVESAIRRGMATFCLTEHIARERIDFYPGEEKDHTEASLTQLYEDFYHEASRLQRAYADRIKLFIGFEGEWIRESSLGIIQKLLDKYAVDLFVGSVHHVHTVPIDYDTELYHKARNLAGGSDERIFEDYFDAQYEMLKALKPPVIGHFDLIRLKSDDPDRSMKTWPAVWEKLLRNLGFVAEYGGVLELNSSSLRKGLSEPYPQIAICKAFANIGGRFTLSDDSHGVGQVGLNYSRVLEAIRKAGIASIQELTSASGFREETCHDQRFPSVCWKAVPIGELEMHPFWQR